VVTPNQQVDMMVRIGEGKRNGGLREAAGAKAPRVLRGRSEGGDVGGSGSTGRSGGEGS
jgi:hypothetical protein